jgi:hypothetical protein
MSLKLNSSGGGSVTLQEPTTASNVTLNLPAADGTVVYENASGNVGIGTSSPSYPLHIVGNTNGNVTSGVTNSNSGTDAFARFLAIADAGNAQFGMTSSGYTGITGAQDALVLNANSASGGIAFALDGVLKSKIDSSGNLLIGTTTAEGRATIRGSTSDSTAFTFSTEAQDGTDQLRVRCDGAVYMGLDGSSPYNLTNGAAANAVLLSDGFLYRSTSSLRYKRDIQDLTHGLSKTLELRPVTYKGISPSDGENIYGGFIAEEVHSAGLSEFVQYDNKGQPDALHYGNMVALCVKAIQEQQAMIEELKAKVAALEAQ